MAHLLRGKQAGIQSDLSAGLSPDLFAIDEVLLVSVHQPYAANTTLDQSLWNQLSDLPDRV